MQGEKRLGTVVLTDAVGFTARMQADEPGALRSLANDHLAFRTVVEAHDGRVVKSTGDGLLCLFESPAQAVRACLAALPMMNELEHRIGIHTGEVTIVEGDVYGDAVNVCARLEREAVPGSVVASRMVLDLVRAQALPSARKIGKVAVKGISEPIELYGWGRPVRRKAFQPWQATRAGAFVGLVLIGGVFVKDRLERKDVEAEIGQKVVAQLAGKKSDSGEVDALLEEAYLQVMDEMAEYDALKSAARASGKVGPVLEWLKSSPMGKRERGQREIEHWSLVEMAISKAGTADVAAVTKRFDGATGVEKLALDAYLEEFALAPSDKKM